MQNTVQVHVWAPELFYRNGGIQTFSRLLLNALCSEISPEQVRVLLKNDLPNDVVSYNGFRNVNAFGRWSLRLRTPRFALECCGAPG